MQDTPDQVASGDGASEYRDPRFAELDAQIKAANAERQQRPAEGKHKRQRTAPALPREIRKEITQFARQLKRQHRHLFTADPKLKDRTARFLRSLLPPHRKRGRPGLSSVSKAIRLLRRFRRQYAQENLEQIWRRVCLEVLPGYADLNPEEQHSQRLLVRGRVHSRQSQHR